MLLCRGTNLGLEPEGAAGYSVGVAVSFISSRRRVRNKDPLDHTEMSDLYASGTVVDQSG
ncbi:unnamed protein product [Rhodiola kirilowii]